MSNGDHAREAVEADLEIWFPHVVEGESVLLYDTTSAPGDGLRGYRGPPAVPNRLLRSTRTRSGAVVDTTTVAEKGAGAGWSDRLSAWRVLLRKAPTDLLLLNSGVPKPWKRRLAGRTAPSKPTP